MSFLPSRQPKELFNFQKEGNFYNWKFSITKAPSDNVLPFNFKIENGNTITIFEARKVSIDYKTVNLIETIDLFPLVAVTQSGDFYYLLADEGLPSNLDKGLYYYHFSDGVNEMESDLFCIDGTIINYINYWADENNDNWIDESGDSWVTM